MLKLHRLLLIAVALAPAWGASGKITASPNPCNFAPGEKVCTSYLAWSTEGVEHARVFVKAMGKKLFPEKEFGTGRTCAKCSASWIEEGTDYVFTLFDYSTGKRGAELASVTVTASGGGAAAGVSGGVTGTISASPNPCRVARGAHECTTAITWQTRGAEHARVFVIAEGKTPEKEFGTGRTCEPGKCMATWIEPGAKYVFTLYDWSTGSRGRMLAEVGVTATAP